MQLNWNILLYILILLIPLDGQDKKILSKKPTAKKTQLKTNNNEKTQAYLDMLEAAFYKIQKSYVDSIDESDIIKAGIKGMMKPLDPYTVFLSGRSKKRLDELRTGKYGGVGIQIGLRRDTLTVLTAFEDSPAWSLEIHSGDQILMIDSVMTKGMTLKEASNLIKGDLGSQVTLTIYRPSTRSKLIFELTRANIKIKHVPYWGVDDQGIGYIRIKKFSKNTAKDFGNALRDLNLIDENMKGLVIDLRGNSGGLLSNAINILDRLTERGVNLLNTKGRIAKSNKTMNSRRAPNLDIDIPIAVLINKSSASASEIVAGVIQDLDRGIIIGTKSFGKGLVQSMYNLNDTTTLKVTTAKYYMPYSDRLIQKEDYKGDGFLTDGLDKKDSTFTTRGGRLVKGGGGITPDVEMKQARIPPYVRGLWKEGVFLTFAADYVPKNKIDNPVFITDKIYQDFEIFLKEYEITYSLPGENELGKLKKSLRPTNSLKVKQQSLLSKFMFWKKNEYNVEKLTEKLDKYYHKKRKGQFWDNENVKWIKNGLFREISLVAYGEKEKIRVSLLNDNVYQEAVDLLLDLNRYYDLLEPDFEQSYNKVNDN